MAQMIRLGRVGGGGWGRDEAKEYIAILAILHKQDVYPPPGAAEG